MAIKGTLCYVPLIIFLQDAIKNKFESKIEGGKFHRVALDEKYGKRKELKCIFIT